MTVYRIPKLVLVYGMVNVKLWFLSQILPKMLRRFKIFENILPKKPPDFDIERLPFFSNILLLLPQSNSLGKYHYFIVQYFNNATFNKVNIFLNGGTNYKFTIV